MKFAYSFLYADSSYPPDWYLDYMKEYIENAFPSYVMQYLPGSYLTVEPADYAYLPEVTPWDSRSYFESVRMQATWAGCLLCDIRCTISADLRRLHSRGRLLPCPSELGLGWDSRLEAGRLYS